MTMTGSSTATNSSPTSVRKVALGILVAAVVAVVVNIVIAAIAHAAGAADEFLPLQVPAFAAFTVIGILGATAGWAIIRQRVKRAASLLRWLVPAVLAVSIVPDLLLLGGDSQPGTSGLAVAALIVMHLAVAAIVVAMLRRVLPVHDRA